MSRGSIARLVSTPILNIGNGEGRKSTREYSKRDKLASQYT